MSHSPSATSHQSDEEVLHELCTSDWEYSSTASRPDCHVFLLNIHGDQSTALTNVYIAARHGSSLDGVRAAYLALTEGACERYASLGELEKQDMDDERVMYLNAWHALPLPLGQLANGARLAVIVHVAPFGPPLEKLRFSGDIVAAPPEYSGRLRRLMADGSTLRVAHGAIVEIQNATDAMQCNKDNVVEQEPCVRGVSWVQFAFTCPPPRRHSSRNVPVASTAPEIPAPVSRLDLTNPSTRC